MPAPADSTRTSWLPSDISLYAALHVAIAAFSLATLATRPQMWADGSVPPYILGVLIFTYLARWSVRHGEAQPRKALLALAIQGVLVCGLTVLSGYYFITSMLAFIIVSVAQACFSQRRAIVFDAILLGAITLTYAAGVRPVAGLQLALGLGAGFLFMIVFTRLALSERYARERLEQANRQLAVYASQVERLAIMHERNRLAREVHDTLGHYLTVMSVQLEVVDKLIDSNPARAKDAARKARELAAEGLSEVRRSTAALRPSPLEDRPLPEALGSLIEASRETGLIVNFEQNGLPRPCSSEIDTLLYRAVQEALTNIRKHAHASAASVCLTYAPAAVNLRIRDNGVGRRGTQDNVGLTALRERAAALNGTVLAENHPDGGFLLEVTLPISNEQ